MKHAFLSNFQRLFKNVSFKSVIKIKKSENKVLNKFKLFLEFEKLYLVIVSKFKSESVLYIWKVRVFYKYGKWECSIYMESESVLCIWKVRVFYIYGKWECSIYIESESVLYVYGKWECSIYIWKVRVFYIYRKWECSLYMESESVLYIWKNTDFLYYTA